MKCSGVLKETFVEDLGDGVVGIVDLEVSLVRLDELLIRLDRLLVRPSVCELSTLLASPPPLERGLAEHDIPSSIDEAGDG